MTPRIAAPFKLAPDAYKAMGALEAAIKASGLEHSLIELVKMRASQINGCAYCIHMHASDARKNGETEMRLYMLNAWRESTFYTPRERADFITSRQSRVTMRERKAGGASTLLRSVCCQRSHASCTTSSASATEPRMR